MELARAYTEQDIRNDLALCAEIAHDYVTDYAGSFEILVSYQERVRKGMRLTIPMIKAVLNCMRYDASVQIMPPQTEERSNVVLFVPRKTFFSEKDQLPQPVGEWAPQKNRYLEIVPVWKKTFGISTGARATVVHRVDPRSHFRVDRELQTWQCHLWWQCSTAWNMSKVPPHLLSDEEAVVVLRSGTDVHSRWSLCKRCEFLASKTN